MRSRAGLVRGSGRPPGRSTPRPEAAASGSAATGAGRSSASQLLARSLDSDQHPLATCSPRSWQSRSCRASSRSRHRRRHAPRRPPSGSARHRLAGVVRGVDLVGHGLDVCLPGFGDRHGISSYGMVVACSGSRSRSLEPADATSSPAHAIVSWGRSSSYGTLSDLCQSRSRSDPRSRSPQPRTSSSASSSAQGPSTPYELKRHVAATIGHIWSFPHALLYKEPARLAALGLLSEERELIGRRRRLFTITPAGQDALRIWLGRPAQHPTELRDLALLQLFFSDLESTAVTLALADEQLGVASASARELRGRPDPRESEREPDDGTLAGRHREDGVALRTRGGRVLGTGRRRGAAGGRRRLSRSRPSPARPGPEHRSPVAIQVAWRTLR